MRISHPRMQYKHTAPNTGTHRVPRSQVCHQAMHMLWWSGVYRKRVFQSWNRILHILHGTRLLSELGTKQVCSVATGLRCGHALRVFKSVICKGSSVQTEALHWLQKRRISHWSRLRVKWWISMQQLRCRSLSQIHFQNMQAFY